MSGMLGGSLAILEAAMRFRVARQATLAGNVANVDTPQYRRMDLHFDGLLEDAQMRMMRTDRSHLPTITGGDSDYRLERGPRGERPDGNGVDLDQEIVAISRNAGAFTDQANILSRLFALRRTAITGQG